MIGSLVDRLLERSRSLQGGGRHLARAHNPVEAGSTPVPCHHQPAGGAVVGLATPVEDSAGRLLVGGGGGPSQRGCSAARVDPRRAIDDHHPVPYQVALATQELIGLLLGDEPFDLAEAAPDIALLADWTCPGLERLDRFVWTKSNSCARIVELLAEDYNPPPELGGEIPPASGPADVEELAQAR